MSIAKPTVADYTAAITADQITAKLERIVNCTDGTVRYAHFMGYRFSEGVKQMAEMCQAYWLIDLVFSHQLTKLRRVKIQTWVLTVDRTENAEFMAAARCYEQYDDARPKANKPIRAQRIPYTDFPLEKIKLYLVDGVLMLESEYRPAIASNGNGKANSDAPFSLGQILATPGALEAMEASGQSAADFVSRHATGDWGEVCEEDRGLNDAALVDGSRLLSVYRTTANVKLWAITEADRSATTILLPSEY